VVVAAVALAMAAQVELEAQAVADMLESLHGNRK
jgi:hypothetical protein